MPDGCRRLWHYPGLFQMFVIFIGVFVLQGLLSQFQWIEQAHLKFRGVLVTTMMKQGGFFLFVFFVFIFHLDISLIELIYVQIICAAVSAFVEYLYIREYIRISGRVHMDWIKKLFGYGKFVFGTYLTTVLSASANQMMLGTLISPAAAGSYNVAIRILNLTDVPTNALGAIVFPQSAKRFAAQGAEAGKYLYEKSVGT